MRLVFKFEVLEKVRTKVKEEHLRPEELIGDLEESEVERMLRLVRNTSHSGLHSLAENLTRRERAVSVTAYVSADKKDLVRKLEIVLTAVARREHIRPAWRITVHHCSRRGLLKLMRIIALNVSEEYPETGTNEYKIILERLSSPDIYKHMLAEIEDYGKTLEEWLKREGRRAEKIPPDSELAKRLRQAIMF